MITMTTLSIRRTVVIIATIKMVMVMTLIVILRPKSESIENHANEGEKIDGQGSCLVPVRSATSEISPSSISLS